MNSSEFNQQIDQTLLAIEDSIEELIQETDMDLDYETSAGILTITLGEGGKLILNRQAPVMQLWLAAKSGGYHLDWDASQSEWFTDRDQESLTELFNRVFTEQTGLAAGFQFDY